MRSPIIVALDYPTLEQALACATQLDPSVVRVKVGKQLFTSVGPAVLSALHELGFDVFLDLKFHDIPNTVAKAISNIVRLKPSMITIHATGGAEMIKAAVRANKIIAKNRKLLQKKTWLSVFMWGVLSLLLCGRWCVLCVGGVLVLPSPKTWQHL